MHTNEEFEKKKEKAKIAANTGDSKAQWTYAKYLMSPSGNYDEYRQGIAFLRLAALQGHCFAQVDLAYALFYGMGYDKDEKEALILCELAIAAFQKVVEEFGQNTPKEDLVSLLLYKQRAVRLRDTIQHLQLFPNCISEAQKAIFHALESHDMSLLEPMLNENVTFSIMCRPTMGKAEMMAWFEKLLSNKDMQVSYVQTERYGMVVECYIPNDKRNLIRSLFIARTNEKGMIHRIAHQAYNGGDYCFTIGSEPFAWEEIEPCLNDVDTARHPQSAIVRGRMFCMSCGKPSQELKWIRFHSNPDRHNGFSYFGRMSVCTDCRQQVEFSCDECRWIG